MKLEDVFFNTKLTCNICSREIFKGYFCKDCEDSLVYNEKHCNTCGRSVLNETYRCNSCSNRQLYFSRARSVFCYLPPISTLIKSYKEKGRKYLGKIFANILYPYVVKYFSGTDIITCVPMHEKDLKARRFNQTEIICREIENKLGYRFENLLVKCKRTKDQRKLGKVDRRINLKSAFKVIDKSLVKGKNILIIDDVMTTGATVEVLSERLISAGAECVNVLTISSVGEKELKEKKNKPRRKNIFQKIIDKLFK